MTTAAPARSPSRAHHAPSRPSLLIYLQRITSLTERAYRDIRRKIVRLQLPPGAIVREDALSDELGIGRTPIREALQRLARDQFVTVLPRRGMLVTPIDVADLTVLYETRALLEPYAARLACQRGGLGHWATMAKSLAGRDGADASTLLDIDRHCHEIIWDAAGNQFLASTLDTLYAQSDRLWHLYLAGVADTADAVGEHDAILTALRAADADQAASLVEAHVRAFDHQVRAAVSRQLTNETA